MRTAPTNIYPFNPPAAKHAPRLPGKWAVTHPAPKNGWTCCTVEIEQNEICEMCEYQQIRNVYVMDHPAYRTLRCGSECAGSMQADPAANTAMRAVMQQKLTARRTCQTLFNDCVSQGNRLPEGVMKGIIVDRLTVAHTALVNGTADKALAATLRRLLADIRRQLASLAPPIPWARQTVSSTLLPGWTVNHNGNHTKQWDNGAKATIFRTIKGAKYRLVVNPASGVPSIFVKQSENDPAVLAAKAEGLI